MRVPEKALCLALLCLTAATAQSPAADWACATTFGNSAGTSHRCPGSCTTWRNQSYSEAYGGGSDVTGTLIYDGSSPVCLAALHAGVLRAGEDKEVSFTSATATDSFVGTIRNRVVSKYKNIQPNQQSFSFSEISFPTITETKLTGTAVIMVHNNNHQSCPYIYRSYNKPKVSYCDQTSVSLTVACIPASSGTQLPFPYFTRWDYKSFTASPITVEITTSSDYLTATSNAIFNSRVLRCLSDQPESDVTSIFGRVGATYTPPLSTVTKSVGEDITFVSVPRGVTINRLPTVNGAITSSLGHLTIEDAGLYSFTGGKDSTDQSYVRLIVRSCPKHRFGMDCAQWCPDCLNSGECHPRSGECVCAPGTYGDRCQYYCPRDRYGEGCRRDCSAQHLRWSSTPSCAGLTFCIHDPKGCSCLPGYLAPNCDSECPPGRYGPDCALSCRYCKDGVCDAGDGRCTHGCLVPALCDASSRPLNLPRFRAPAELSCSNTACAVALRAWSPRDDEGTLEPGNYVTGYRLQVKSLSSSDAEWKTPEMSTHSTEFKFNFVPGWWYAVRVLVDTSRGSADTDYNLDIRQTEVQIACLTEATYGKLNLFEEEVTMNRIVVGGVNSAACDELSINFSVKEASTQATVRQQGRHGHQLWADDLTPNTTYVFSVNSASLSVTTLPRALPKPYKDFPGNTSGGAIVISLRDRTNVFERTRRVGCSDKEHENVRQSLSLYEPRVLLTQLEAYTEYEVCVLAFNRGGSSETCGAMLTLPNSAPTLPVTQLKCLSDGCSVHVGDGCSQYNGPNLTLVWTFSGAPACNASARHSLRFENKLSYFGTFNSRNLNLLPGITYNLSVFVKNDYGEGQPVHATYASPNEKVPGPVEELTSTATPTSVSLRWRRPCPPKAPILGYRVTVGRNYQFYSESECPGNAAYFCLTFTALNPDQTYKFEVKSCSDSSYYAACSAAEPISVKTQETAPEPPTMTQTRRPKGLNISFTSSGANTKQCFIETFHGGNLISNNTYDIIGNGQQINTSFCVRLLVVVLQPRRLFTANQRLRSNRVRGSGGEPS
ncbi:uncharacterized protein LOC125179286 [Hyalella azteca]|uniref:Uncharacterized protein LOC125179286 n=1 Tax=Hyalella azteca TaxID=294128 RepID=A0A979FUC6_HYAAZ|nr:uncharacterized protein LOC125179286 [Hyalella azteca]